MTTIDGPLRVLQIEDSANDAFLVEMELRKSLPDCAIRCVDDRDQFIEALEAFAPQLILSDHQLGSFTGMEALAISKERAPETPFVFVTGSMDEETAVACVKAGAWDYVLKEKLVRLAPAVTAALELRGTRAALRQTEEQLLQTQKLDALGQLAGGVAHDYNNLTTVILGFTTLVLEALPADDPRRADLAEVVKASERAAELSGQLLAFSRKQVIQFQPVSLNDVVENAEWLLKRLIRKDIILTTRLSPDLASTHSDPGQLQQVLMNLVVNARDALPSGGEIVIETRAVLLDANSVVRQEDVNSRPYLCLSVRDNGVGMDQATQARIFEPFFTTKARGQGTGLGLAMVYGIVRQSGGHVAIDSALGRGTTASVYVPVASSVHGVAPSCVVLPSQRLTGTETILIAEDEPGLRTLARRVLQGYGYATIEAGNGTEAVQAGAAAASLHLLLADMVMPGLSGPGLFHAVRAHHPGLRAVYMSGYAEQADALREVQAMGGAFLAKPFQPMALARKVRDELDR